MEKTIEIPEGYEARIEGNKVILEPKESENERIRNLLYCLIRDRSDNKKLLEHNGASVDMALAWIEKQGKPKMAANAIREGITHYGITQYQIDNWLKKYVEVESTEPKSSVLPKYGIGDVIRLKNSNHEFIISHITDEYYHSNGAFIEIRMADDVNGNWEYVRHIQPAADTTKEDVLDWLKSIKARYTWKPSDEQIISLSTAIAYCLGDKEKTELKSLLDDLKKLKG